MRFENVEIASIGYDLAPIKTSSEEIEERLGKLYQRLALPKGRLALMTGITDRRFYDLDERPSRAASRAAVSALTRANIDIADVDCIINGSVCRDFLEPATATEVAKLLGADESTLLYDISNACLGVLNGMLAIANMIELSQIDTGIVVAGELGESLVNATIDSLNNDPNLTRKTLKPSIASLTIGSGAVALLLTRKELCNNGHKLLGYSFKSAVGGNDLCSSINDVGFSSAAAPLMNTDSEKLLIEGCKLASSTWAQFLKNLNWTKDDVKHIFTHQVGSIYRKTLYEYLEMPIEKDYETVSFLGNIGSVSAPITLAIGADKRIIEKGENVALLGIGSGLNSLMFGIEW
ncbi:MAG: 3-oxoacyl-ACP synthase III [Nitrospinota bacterium]